MKYEKLSEGLEVAEVGLSSLNLNDRLDAEYFSKENQLISKRLHEKSTRRLGELGKFAVSAFYPAATHLYAEGDVAFMRCVDCINHPVISQLQEDSFERIPSSFLAEHGTIDTVSAGDIVITKVGSPCYASIVHEHGELALSRTVMGLKNIEGVDAYYLLAFLRSKYGFGQLLRQRELTIQYQLTVDRVKAVEVVIPTSSFQSKVRSIVEAFHEKLQENQRLHAEAEHILLSELGLLNWHPPELLTYERKASEASAAKRFDAEYYQPKYDALFALLAAKGDLRLGHHVTEQIRRGISPEYVEEDGDTVVINSKHVGKTHVEVEDNRRTMRAFLEGQDESPEDEQKSLKRGEVKVGDVLLNSTGMITIGRCQCLLDDVSAVVDNHVAIIRPNQGLDPVYLACFLNTLPGQMQTERGWTGSSGQIELRPDVIADYRVWNAPHEV